MKTLYAAAVLSAWMLFGFSLWTNHQALLLMQKQRALIDLLQHRLSDEMGARLRLEKLYGDCETGTKEQVYYE